jgi:GGDEF domain-containing protein
MASEHDEFTGLLNERTIHKRLKEVFCDSVRFNFQFSIIIMSVDYAESSSQISGQTAADSVILEISDLLKENMKIYDVKTRYSNREGFLYNFYIAGRFVNNEFCIILPHCSGENAQKTAQHILQSIGMIRFAGIDEGQITSSIGISVYDPFLKCDDEKDIIKVAFNALNLAKENGAGRIEMLYY